MFNKDHKLSLARFGMILVLLAGMLAATPVSQVRAATLTVTTTSDSGPGSLRQAMMDAASGTTIRFDPSLAGQTITLSTPVNLTNKRLILDGSGLSPQVTISGGGFNLNGPTVGMDIYDLTLSGFGVPLIFRTDMTIRNSILKDFTTDVLYANAPASLTIVNSTLENNDGLAIIANGGTVVSITDSVIRNNVQALRASAAEVTITNSTVSDHDDDAIVFSGLLTIIDSTLMDSYGWMIVANGDLSLIDTTIHQTATEETLLINGGTQITVVNSTIVTESSGDYESIRVNGGSDVDIYNSTIVAINNQLLFLNGGSPFSVYNSILLCAHENECIFSNNGTINDVNSLVGVNGIPAEYGLNAPDDNGGPTLTVALSPGSPLIDAGDDAVCMAAPVNNLDQRGVARPSGSHCDIGAYEYNPEIHYVKWDADGTKDGSSWTDAYTDLQSALAAASSEDEIWVATGIYKPATGADRTATFQLKSNVAIYGGFDGTEIARYQRNVFANVTILSGDIDNNDSQTPVITDLATVTGNTTNSFHVVTGATGAILDGFTITAGNANEGPECYGTACGGGMYNESSSPKLTNVTFSGNSAVFMGGGMLNYDSSSPTLTNVTFSGNSANTGGGMVNDESSSPTLTNVTFSGNSADEAGGGMVNYSSNPTLTNVTFSGNSADYGGGGMANVSSVPRLRNTILWGNTAPTDAQIFNYYGIPGASSTPDVSDSVVQGGCPTGSICSNIIITDPKLGPLGSYGGATPTIPLLPGSFAIDAGNDTICQAAVGAPDYGAGGLDQRGVTRPQGAKCDIGAYEVSYLTIAGNAGTGGAIVKYGYSSFTTADNDGNYSVQVPPGWTDTVIPIKLGYSFAPAKIDYTDVQVDQSNQGYTATANTYSYPGDPEDIWRVSISNSGEQADDDSYDPSISADGRYVAFSSTASTLTPQDTDYVSDIFVYDNQTGDIELASIHSDGTKFQENSSAPSISADGRYVAFVSIEWWGTQVVFVHDRQTGTTTGLPFRGPPEGSTKPSISADGRYIAYMSNGILTEGDRNSMSDIFIYDQWSTSLKRVSISSSGTESNGDSAFPSISADGRYVTFQSSATNLVNDDTNGVDDIFVHDIQTGETRRVSVDSSGLEANGGSLSPSLSGDGRYVVFHSTATDLVDNDTNSEEDVFVHDLQTHETSRVSVNNSGGQGNQASDQALISANGNYVVFRSHATNLIPDDTNGAADIFVYDRQRDKTRRVSVTSDGTEANGDSPSPYYVGFSISEDGKYLAFSSDATNLVDDDTNGYSDIFVREMSDQSPTILSIARANANPISASNVKFTVTFSRPVAGVDTGDFTLDATGGITGATINVVTPDAVCAGNMYCNTCTVTVGTGIGNGTLRLDIPVDASITDATGNSVSNLPFITSETYTIEKTPTLGSGMYDDTNAALLYSGNWSTWSGTGPLNNTMHYTNASTATAIFAFQAPAKFVLTFSKNTNRSNILISVDGGTAIPVSAYSSSSQWRQTYTSAMYSDTGAHTVTISTPGDGKYIDIDAIQIVAPPTPHGVGIYDDTNAAWTYAGTWATWSGTGPYANTLHYAHATGASASFTFQAPAKFVLTYSTNTNRGNIMVSVDGGTAVPVNSYGSAVWQKTYASLAYADSGVHTVTISTPGDGKYIDVDAIQILALTDLVKPAAISDPSATTGTATGSVNLSWTAVGDDGTTGTAAAYRVRYSTSAINSEATWNAATPVTSGIPTPLGAGTLQNMTVSGLTPDQTYYFAIRAQDEEPNLGDLSTPASATAQAMGAAGAGMYDDADANWKYTGSWSTWSGTGPYSNTMHYTNASGATATFKFQAPARFILSFQKASNRSNILVSMDGGTAIPISAYSASSQWQQTYTSVPYLDTGSHTVVVSTPGDGKYIDIDAIQILALTDLVKPAAISDLSATTGTATGSVNLSWTAVGDDGTTGTATSYLVRYSTSAINSEATWNAATPVTSGIPTPLVAGTVQNMIVSGLTPDQNYYFAIRAQDEEPNLGDVSNPASAIAQALGAAGAGMYDDADANWTYTGSWSTWSGTGPYSNTMHYTNASGATATFKFQAPARFILSFQKASNRSNILVSMDGGTAVPVSAYSSSGLWRQTYTSAMYSDTGSHTVVVSTPGDGKYIDIDAIQIVAPPTPLGVGTYDNTNAGWTYTGSWGTYNGTGPLNNTLHYSNATGATATFTFQGPAKFVFTYSTNTNRGNILISVDGGAAVPVNAYGSALWLQTYTSPTYTGTGSHTVTISTPGDGTYIDVDAIQIQSP